MKIGDTVRIKIGYGFWKKGHEGKIKFEKFKAQDHSRSGKLKNYDFGVLLDGDTYVTGFDEFEIEEAFENRTI